MGNDYLVTIIFQNAPQQNSSEYFRGLRRNPEYTIAYVDTLLHKNFYIPKNIGYDTLSIPAKYGFVEILHRYNLIEDVPYLLIAGDSVLFTYDEYNRPNIKSLKSEANTRIYNVLWSDPRSIQSNGYSINAILNESRFGQAYKLIKEGKTPQVLINELGYDKLYCNLDSLQQVYLQYTESIKLKFDTLVSSGVISKNHADYYFCKIGLKQQSVDDVIQNDSLKYYISNYTLLLSNRHNYTKAPKGTKAPQLFDLIAADSSLQTTTRNIMLRETLYGIQNTGWTPYPPQLVAKYEEKYRQITGDSLSYNKTINNKNTISEYSADLLLKNFNGEEFKWQNVINKYKGKVIYVDFWASWCTPCRAEMPEAKQLRESYKDKDVVFVYLAVNDKEQNWRQAVKDCQTDYLGDNYFVSNTSTANLLKEIKFNTIPRLLLYDKNGKLVDTDAPRPSSEQIQPLIDKYLMP
ncbi:MAG: TlpA family protein disulfide reductase [Alistipes sp.]|nr:TlpA family protein disulfide reductase [Alistipes sp.]